MLRGVTPLCVQVAPELMSMRESELYCGAQQIKQLKSSELYALIASFTEVARHLKSL